MALIRLLPLQRNKKRPPINQQKISIYLFIVIITNAVLNGYQYINSAREQERTKPLQVVYVVVVVVVIVIMIIIKPFAPPSKILLHRAFVQIFSLALLCYFLAFDWIVSRCCCFLIEGSVVAHEQNQQ